VSDGAHIYFYYITEVLYFEHSFVWYGKLDTPWKFWHVVL